MLIESMAIVAAAAVFDSQVIPGHERPNSGVRQLATRAPERPVTGMLWAGRLVMGGVDLPEASVTEVAHGAHNASNAIAYVRVGQLMVGINPWVEMRAPGLAHLEAGRQEWLAERGYTGAVRTFMNDANFVGAHEHMQHAAAPETVSAPIVPRAVIELAPDAPRHRSRLRVEAPRVIRVLPMTETRVAAK